MSDNTYYVNRVKLLQYKDLLARLRSPSDSMPITVNVVPPFAGEAGAKLGDVARSIPDHLGLVSGAEG